MSRFQHEIPSDGEQLIIMNIERGLISPAEAERSVNIQMITHVGDLIVAGQPKLFIDEEEGKFYWKVPFCFQTPIGQSENIPLGVYALVDAVSGAYEIDEETVQRIEGAAEPISRKIYPGNWS